MQRPKKSISPIDWKRAMYIDFEGRVKDPESFLGVACEGKWIVYILEPLLWSAATHGHIKGRVIATTRTDAFRLIRSRAESESRVIAAWSQREQDAIQRTPEFSEEDRDWWQANLIDAKKPAKKMARLLGIHIEERKSSRTGNINKNSLASYLKATGYQVPRLHGPNNSAQRILYVRNQIISKGSFENITSTAKRKWTNGLSHNFHDCIGLAHVMNFLAQASKTNRPN